MATINYEDVKHQGAILATRKESETDEMWLDRALGVLKAGGFRKFDVSDSLLVYNGPEGLEFRTMSGCDQLASPNDNYSRFVSF